MFFKILKYLVAIFIFLRLSHQQTTPSERCKEQNGGSVCVDCFRTGTCNISGSSITIEDVTSCPTEVQTYCDDTLYSNGSYGICTPIPASYTNCSCSSTSECIADINNPAVVLHCESDTPVTDPACSGSAIDLTTCGCLSCSSDCPLVDDPSNDCGSYFLCEGTTLTPYSCSSGLCFNQTSCGCVESAESTTIAPTADPSCPLIDDPNDDCAGYFVLSGNVLIPLNCTGTLCFDQTACGCVAQSPSSSSTTTTSSSACIFVDDPNDDCGSFFIYDGSEFIASTCPGTQCFNQAECGCLDDSGSASDTTTSTTTVTTTTTSSSSITCTTDCPFADDPDSSAACGSFYICDGSDVIKAECPGNLCFDQTSCECIT